MMVKESVARSSQRVEMRPWIGIFFSLLIPLFVHGLFAAPHLSSAYVSMDAQVTYLPLAERFLQDPGSLFQDEVSLHVAPGSYIYMALLGADVERIKWVNFGLSLLVLGLLYDAATRLAGRMGGAAAAWLYATSPLLVGAAIAPLAEAPFLFWVSVWLWAASRLHTQPRLFWPVLAGGAALGIATLTRGLYYYWIFVAVVVCAVWGWRGRAEQRPVARRLMIMHLIAAVLVGGYVLRNKVEFGVPVIATGSGAALYFGSNPTLSGYEPPYYDLLHEHWIILDGHEHLSLEGDRRLAKVAFMMLRDMPLEQLLGMYVQKLGAVLFSSKAVLDDAYFNDRSARILLLVLAFYALWFGRRSILIWMLAGILLYQAAIHTVVMYNDRYSNGGLGTPLTLLAAIGVGLLWGQSRRWMHLAWAAGIILLGVGMGIYHQRHTGPLMPDLSKGFSTEMAKADVSQIEFAGFDAHPFLSAVSLPTGRATIAWRIEPYAPMGGVPVVRLDYRELDPGCKAVQINFHGADGRVTTKKLRIKGMAR
ncbi:MAG: glycosyltransferase family 39 protein, partial [Gammaproteobacteria bacterium]|nr:glycosyltransferase family 39 protein [Gammaproteobacteria bacterium]